MSKKIISIFAIFLSLAAPLVLEPLQVLANESINIEYVKINPDNGIFYKFKRLKERVWLDILSVSPNSKINYYQKLLDHRLAELKYITDKKDTTHIQKASQRYSTFAGQLAEYILDKNLDAKKQETKEFLASHLPVVEKMKQAYDPTTAQWRFVEYDVDYLEIYISQLED